MSENLVFMAFCVAYKPACLFTRSTFHTAGKIIQYYCYVSPRACTKSLYHIPVKYSAFSTKTTTNIKLFLWPDISFGEPMVCGHGHHSHSSIYLYAYKIF